MKTSFHSLIFSGAMLVTVLASVTHCTPAEPPKDATGSDAMSGSSKKAGEGYPFYIGTYTKGWACGDNHDCRSSGIYRATFDPETGEISDAVRVADTVNPSYLTISKDGQFLYAVNEVGDFHGEDTGGVSAFRIQRTGQLKLLNQLSSHGADPAHLSLSASGKELFVTNYSGGSLASYTIAEDGSLRDADNVKFVGSGPHKNQRSPHGHFVVEGPEGGRVYVADLGTDKVHIFKVEEGGKLTPNQPAFGSTPAGAGPRHLAFSADNRFLYANAELSSHVVVFEHDAGTGGLRKIQTINTVPESYLAYNNTAEIVLSKDGRFLFVANRGQNTIASFSVNQGDGKLTMVDTTSAGVDWPRDFKLDPTGNYLLVEGQKSDNIAVLKIDTATGELSNNGSGISISKPVNIAFLP